MMKMKKMFEAHDGIARAVVTFLAVFVMLAVLAGCANPVGGSGGPGSDSDSDNGESSGGTEDSGDEGDGADDSGVPTFVFAYEANGADGGSLPAESTEVEEDEELLVLGNTGGLTRSEHTFGGWNIDPDGNGTHYRAGDTFVMPSEDVTLYAQWNPPLAESGDETDVQHAFESIVKAAIEDDPGSGFTADGEEEGVYRNDGQGGADMIRFTRINASGEFSFEATLESGPGNNPTGSIGVYITEPDGERGEEVGSFTLGLNAPQMVAFELPASDFEIEFEGGNNRKWAIGEFSLSLD